MKDYTTLIFDAFDTVVHINRNLLPFCDVEGQQIRTTAPAVYAAYVEQCGEIQFDEFYAAFSQSSARLDEIRQSSHVELPCERRFALMLRMLAAPADAGEDATNGLAGRLAAVHMRTIQQALEVRRETIEVLDWVKPRFRVAMISNFDYAPALYETLEHFGIRSAFEAILVSIEVGWRKPHPIIFDRMLHHLGVRAADALYIGDQLYLDVLGATRSGMDVAWLETGREVWTPEFPEPTYRLRSIYDLKNVVRSEDRE